jgi:hypothetical protein
LAALLLMGVAIPKLALGDDGKRAFKAELDGYQQVPSFSSSGTGEVRVHVAPSDDEAEYELSFADVQGSIVLFAHLHFGRPGVNGGTIAFLCSNSPPLPDVPLCPDVNGGSVVGTLDASRVVGPIGQGIAPGDFDALVRALRAGATYVNVHTNASTPGEMRGNILAR